MFPEVSLAKPGVGWAGLRPGPVGHTELVVQPAVVVVVQPIVAVAEQPAAVVVGQPAVAAVVAE